MSLAIKIYWKEIKLGSSPLAYSLFFPETAGMLIKKALAR